MKRIIFVAAIFLHLISCGNGSNQQDKYYDEPVALKMASSEQSYENSETTLEPKIIKSGNLTFESKDLNANVKEIERLIDNYKVRIIENSGNNSEFRNEKIFFLNIPSDKYEYFIKELERILGEPEYKHINSQDITVQYIDSEARMTSKKKLEERYLELLNRANSVSEIMEIERELANLRAEIESYQNVLKTYDSQIKYSSLRLTIYQKNVKSKNTAWGDKFAQSFSRGWEYFIWFFVGLFSLWPFFILGTVIVILVIKLSARRKRNKIQK